MNKILRRTMLAAGAVVLVLAPLTAVASDVLPYSAFIVETPSMSPMIPPASLVVVEKGAYEVGQAITFHTNNGVVTHRLIEINADGTLTTKGDANETVDPSPTTGAAVIGGVVASLPALGLWVTYLKNPLMVASIVVLALVLLFVFAPRRRHQPEAITREREALSPTSGTSS